MFEALSKYETVIVSGLHRARTRLATKCIAHDTGLYPCLENYASFGVATLMDLLDDWTPKVIQSPGYVNYLYRISRPDTLIVFVHRDIGEIRRSRAKAVNWDGAPVDFDSIERGLCRQLNVQAFGQAHKLILENWEAQKTMIRDYLEIDSDSLKDHPLYTGSTTRADGTAFVMAEG